MRLIPRLAAWSLALLSLPLSGAAAPLAPPIEAIRAQLRLGDVEAAVDAGDAAIEQRGDDAQAWLWAGRAYGRQAIEANLLTKAKWAGRTRDAWLKAVELQPDLLEARFDLMQYYLQAPGLLGGGRDKAEVEAREIAGRSPSMGQLAAAVLAQVDDDKAAAEQLYREALALDPGNGRARLALSGYLQAAERMAEVKALWSERLQQAPDDTMAIYQLGRHAALTGEDLEAGLAHLDAFVARGEVPDESSLAAAHWRRGQILARLNRPAEAEAALRLAMADRGIAELAKADLKRLGESKRG